MTESLIENCHLAWEFQTRKVIRYVHRTYTTLKVMKWIGKEVHKPAKELIFDSYERGGSIGQAVFTGCCALLTAFAIAKYWLENGGITSKLSCDCNNVPALTADR